MKNNLPIWSQCRQLYLPRQRDDVESPVDFIPRLENPKECRKLLKLVHETTPLSNVKPLVHLGEVILERKQPVVADELFALKVDSSISNLLLLSN